MQKGKSKGNITSNCRLITCLPLMWKLLLALLGVIVDQTYGHDLMLTDCIYLEEMKEEV